ncbi:hypothetical protein [Nonomuraea angiospora]|uniref:hypothetical protein n=1 Tax=Nonomuraea angiospora TaxID=46172 RepID=UPI0029B4CE0A|nr:hypothetical protein [Nonomuraea angiospora]MDX3111362.1 hypothetical protein [Nonomuraea angiospora]
MAMPFLADDGTDPDALAGMREETGGQVDHAGHGAAVSDAEAEWRALAGRVRERWQRPADIDAHYLRIGRWHLGQASRLLPTYAAQPDTAVHALGPAALADLAPLVAPILARPNASGLRPGGRVRCWPDGADDSARYRPGGHLVLTAALLEASAQAASEATRAAPAWLDRIDQAAPLAPPGVPDGTADRMPDLAARDAAAGTHPRLRSWARCCFGPSLPAPTLGEHAVIAPIDAGLWGDFVANWHWALGHLILADDSRQAVVRLLLVLWAHTVLGVDA